MSETASHTGLSQADLRRSILEFLAVTNDAKPADGHSPVDIAGLGDDDNIFDLGLVDSLTLAELLVRVEHLGEVELDMLTVEPETFFTLRGLLSHIADLRSAAAAARTAPR